MQPERMPKDPAQSARQRAAEDLFEAVRSLPEPERHAAVDAGSDDPWVREEVRSLLRFDGPTRATMGGQPADDFDADACIGLSTGGFTLRSVIGVGGMGTVFSADQVLPTRRIAVKVLHAATTRPTAIERFRRESEFLARLEHPNIARVISAGTLHAPPSGVERPYFAMELVEGGRAITAWAREGPADRREVVRMLATACEAVGAGHRAGVAHLDLKPGNLLVSRSGALRVIDYGIARPVEEPAADGDAPFSGTPQYMSPEQCVRGARVDSRADVYALGLILHELLARRLPYETRGLPFAAIARTVRESEPPALRRIDSTIPRELEAIARMATAKNPDARYGTAAELGDDLRRWLDDEPVLALKAHAAQALLRLIRRNPIASTVATIAALAVIVGTAVSLRFAVHASDAASAERVSAARARVQAASGAIAVGEPAEAVAHLDLVPAELRGWEWRHLRARVDNHELYAASPNEILSVDSIDATDEVVGGVTHGSLLVADRLHRKPPVRYDLREAFANAEGSYILSVAGSADGSRIYLVTHELDVLVIDRRDDSLRRIARGAMRARPSGRFVACAMVDGSVALVDPETTEVVARSSAGSARIMDVSIAKNGRSALLTLMDGSLRMVDIDADAPAARERWRTAPQPLTSRAPAVSPDGSVAMVAWRDDRIRRYDAATGAVVAESHLAGGSVFMLAISPDNRTAAASSWANEVRLIDTETLALTRRLSGTVAHVWGIDFTADGSRIVGRVLPSLEAAKLEGKILECLGAWLVGSDAAVRDDSVHADAVAATAGPEPGVFTLVGSDGAIVEYDAREGATRRLGEGPLRAIRVARAADWIAIGDADGVLHRYELRDGKATASWRSKVFPISFWALAASPDGSVIVCGDKRQSIATVSAADGEVLWTREIPAEGSETPIAARFVSRIVFLDEGRLVTYAARLSGVPRAVFRTQDGAIEPPRSIGVGVEADDAVHRARDGRIYSLGVTGPLFVDAPRAIDQPLPLARNGGVMCLDAAEDRLFVATRDGSVRVVGFDPPLAIARLDAANGMPLAIAFDDSRDALTVVSNQGIARTWFGATVGRAQRDTASLLPAPDDERTLRLAEESGGK
jgi:WD40 repeat protein